MVRQLSTHCLVLLVFAGLMTPALVFGVEPEVWERELKRLQERVQQLEAERELRELDRIQERLRKLEAERAQTYEAIDKAIKEIEAAKKAKAIDADKEAQAAPAKKLDPEALRKAIMEIEAADKAKQIEAGKRAAAKPRGERTDEDFSVMARQRMLEKGILPGYMTIPGTNTQFKIGGYVRIDSGYNVKKINSDDFVGSFASYAIKDGERGHGDSGNARIDPSATRFNFDMQTPTPGYGQFDNINVFFEGDFWPDLSRMRLRHAYGKWGPLFVGQTWPMFMDVAAQTPNFDYSGPVASTPVREPEIRWDQPFGEHFKLGLNLTDPDGQLSIPSVGGQDVANVKNSIPDFAFRALYTQSWGHLQFSGMGRLLQVDDAQGEFSNDSAFGWGTLFSGKFGTLGSDALGFGLTYGDGFARWRTGLGGNDQDALLKTSGLKTVQDYGGWVNYTHYWNPHWSSSVSYSHIWTDNPSGSPDSYIKNANYLLGNLIWRVTPVLNTGLEFTYVSREDEDNGDGNLIRIKWGIMWKFHTDAPTTSAYERIDYLYGGG